MDRWGGRNSNSGHVEGLEWAVTAMSANWGGKYGKRFNNSGVLPEKVMTRIVSF